MNYEILKHVIITSPQTTGPHTCPGPYQRRCRCVAELSSLYILSLLDSSLRAGWVRQGGGIEPSRLWAHEGKNCGLESHVFSYCSWGSQGKNTELVCHSLLQWTTFCQTSPPMTRRLGWPHTAWLSFTELDKAVVLWSDWLVVCDCGFSLSSLWSPLSVPTVLLGYLHTVGSGHRTGKGQFSFQSQGKAMPKNAQTTAQLHSSHTLVMLKILQARLQQYVNREHPDVQTGFRKGRGTRDQIANIHWIIEKAREFQKNIYFCFTDYAKAFDCVDHSKLENSERDGNTRPPDLPLQKPVCRSESNS